jgi:hypothetical protein
MNSAMIVAMHSAHLGRVYVPGRLLASKSYRNSFKKPSPGEIGIFVATHRKPRFNVDGVLVGFDTVWSSVTHNERVDAGAQKQAVQVFGGGGTPAAPSATVYFNVIAIASAVLTKAKGDQSLGSTSSGVTTNEFTTIGLSRAVATQSGANYTAPASLGAQFAQKISRLFTASGTGTARGAGVFDSTTVAGSIMYAEDNFSSDAVLNSADTLTVEVTVNN